MAGNHQDLGDIILRFIRMIFGGAILGTGMGIVMTFWMRFMHNNPLLEVNLTVFATYLVFFIAEFTHLEVSGVLSVVAMGLYMSH